MISWKKLFNTKRVCL